MHCEEDSLNAYRKFQIIFDECSWKEERVLNQVQNGRSRPKRKNSRKGETAMFLVGNFVETADSCYFFNVTTNCPVYRQTILQQNRSLQDASAIKNKLKLPTYQNTKRSPLRKFLLMRDKK